MSNVPPFHFATVVWGAEYVNTFVDIMLPSLLAPDNIPCLPNLRDCVYKVFTTEEDFKAIESSGSFHKLRDLTNVKLLRIESFGENQYVTSTGCYRTATDEARVAGAVILFLIPDMVLANGGIRTILRHIEAGKLAVLMGGLRTLKESLLPELASHFKKGHVLTAPPRELVALAAPHLHPIMQNHVYDGPSVSFHPSFFCWSVKDEGFVAYNCHLHPVAVNMAKMDAQFNTTIDDALLGSDESVLAIVDDSDDLVWFELSNLQHWFGALTEKRLWEIIVWLDLRANSQQRRFLRHRLRIHSTDCDSEAWRQAEKRAKEVVETIAAALDLEAKRIRGFPGGYAPGNPNIIKFDLFESFEEYSPPVRAAIARRLATDALRVGVRRIERRARGFLINGASGNRSALHYLAKWSLANVALLLIALGRSCARGIRYARRHN